jgi:hypothetical protein
LTRGSCARIRQAVHNLVDLYPGATWIAGGAIGTDQIVADLVLRLGQRLELVLPFPPPVQSKLWSVRQRQTLLDQIAQSAAVEIISDRYNLDAYHQRNRRMVQRADLLVACWNGIPFGGTAATVYEAYKQRVPVYVVPI